MHLLTENASRTKKDLIFPEYTNIFNAPSIWLHSNLTKTFLYSVESQKSKKSCGIFIEVSIVHKIGYNNAI